MAKGQKRKSREAKKPKASKTVVAAPSTSRTPKPAGGPGGKSAGK